MFWKYNAGACSHLETLLSKEEVTLFEVLDEEDIVQECRVQNKKLIDYLLRPEILEHLVSLTTEEPSQDVDEKQRFRYSNIACELLTCDVPQLNERLAGSETLLIKLYSFLNTPPPLNPLLASFFSKAMTGLVTRRAEQNWYSYQFTCLQVLEFLKTQEDTVGLLIKHLGTSAIMDLLQRLITGVEGNDMRKNVLTWLEGQNVVQRIIDLMGPETEPERHCNASQLLLDIIRISRDSFRTCSENNGPDPILEKLESPETASSILDLMLSGEEQRSDSAIVGGVAVLLTLLETSRLPLDDSSDKNDDKESNCQSSLSKAMVPRLKDLHDVLINPPKRAAIKTTAENLDPPFGNTRLQICRLISALIATQDTEILSSLAELGTVGVLLDLFFTYKWNNFLHSQVEQCVALLLQSLSAPDAAPKSLYLDQTFTKSPGSSPSTPPPEIGDASGSPKAEDSAEDKGVNEKPVKEKAEEAQLIEPNPLVINLFGDARLVGRIIEAYKQDKDGSLPKLKCGYFGHLVHIINYVNEHVTDEQLEKLVPSEETRSEWRTLLDGPIAEINKIQSEFLGGQHPSKIIESEDGDYPIVPFSQDESVLQNFTELLTCYKSTPFSDGSYDDNQFFDGEDPLQLGGSDEMARRQELFFDVCNQKMMERDDDDFDQELNFNSPTTPTAAPTVRPSLGSDDSDEEEQPAFHSAGAMEIDNVDPWADTPATGTVSAVTEADPWGSSSEAAVDKDAGDQDGWANFCAFTSPSEEAAEAVKDVENNPGAAEIKSEDNNANPPMDTPDENSELVDNYRFLSQGLLSSEGAAGLPVPQDESSSTETPPDEQKPESQEADVAPDSTNNPSPTEDEKSI